MRVAPTAAQSRAEKLARIGYDRFNPDDRLGFALMLEDLGPEVAAGVRYGRTGEPISIEVGPELDAWAHERVGLDVPRATDAATISKILRDAAGVSSGWIAGYLSGSEASSSCKDDDEARELARVMTAYGDSPKPVWERALSISAFSDSKALAARGWDARIVRATASQGVVDASAALEAALTSLGILRNPPAGRLIGGDVSLEFADGRVDLRSCGLSGFFSRCAHPRQFPTTSNYNPHSPIFSNPHTLALYTLYRTITASTSANVGRTVSLTRCTLNLARRVSASGQAGLGAPRADGPSPYDRRRLRSRVCWYSILDASAVGRARALPYPSPRRATSQPGAAPSGPPSESFFPHTPGGGSRWISARPLGPFFSEPPSGRRDPR